MAIELSVSIAGGICFIAPIRPPLAINKLLKNRPLVRRFEDEGLRHSCSQPDQLCSVVFIQTD